MIHASINQGLCVYLESVYAPFQSPYMDTFTLLKGMRSLDLEILTEDGQSSQNKKPFVWFFYTRPTLWSSY